MALAALLTRAPTSPSIPHCPPPLTFPLCPWWFQDGLAGRGWWVMAPARTWSTCQDFSCRPRSMAITIIANNWSLMKMDGVSDECSEVISWANSQYLFQSIGKLVVEIQQVKRANRRKPILHLLNMQQLSSKNMWSKSRVYTFLTDGKGKEKQIRIIRQLLMIHFQVQICVISFGL